MAKTLSTAGERTAVDMLKQDHDRMLRHFADFARVDRQNAEAVRAIVETACLELQIHSLLEEEIFYPAVREAAAAEVEDELLNESQVEHETADELIAKLHELEPEDPMYCAYFTVLIHNVKRHVSTEQDELFPRVEQMSGLNLRELAAAMHERREELFAELESGDEAPNDEDDGSDGSTVDADGDDSFENDADAEISRTRH